MNGDMMCPMCVGFVSRVVVDFGVCRMEEADPAAARLPRHHEVLQGEPGDIEVGDHHTGEAGVATGGHHSSAFFFPK